MFRIAGCYKLRHPDEMKIKEITSSAGVTVGLPNYSSIRYEYSACATLSENESHDVAQGALDDLVCGHVHEVAQFAAKYQRLPVASDFKRSGSTDP